MRRILFLNLTTFSHNGGIEKFNKCFLKALVEIGKDGNISSAGMSAYDGVADNRYYTAGQYTGLRGNKILFILKSVWAARAYDTVIIGHINLSIAGVLVKMLFPGKKIILVTHGIEVWDPLKGVKKRLLDIADNVLTVSNFTRKKLCSIQNITEDKIIIFHNTIDPFFAIPTHFYDDTHLRDRYNIREDDQVLFTLARVSSTEKYKGYDIVLECLPAVLAKFPNVKYVIGGKYDAVEKARIDDIIAGLKLENNVILTGFIKDDELVAHYQMGDIFIMPSRKEGFGIVFIEAMVCGLPVIAGNIDGSVDALKNGELGTLLDPLNKDEITEQLCYLFENKHYITDDYKYQLQQKALQNFGFEMFKDRLKNIIEH